MDTLAHHSIQSCLDKVHLMDTCNIKLAICHLDRRLCQWVVDHLVMGRRVRLELQECLCLYRAHRLTEYTRRECRLPLLATCLRTIL